MFIKKKLQASGFYFILLALAPVCFFLGWKYYHAVDKFMLNATETVATVTGYQLKNDGTEDGLSFYPRVAFTDQQGNKRVATVNLSYAEKPDYVGQQLSVLYSLKDQQDVRVNSFRGLWGAPVVLSGAGLLFLIIGIWCLI